MACGLPCVIANGGGSKSFIEDGINGYVVSPNNPMAYLDEVEALLNNKAHRENIIQLGIEYTKASSWDDLVTDYYRQLRNLKRNSCASDSYRVKPVVDSFLIKHKGWAEV